jgi:hypothetical protein
MDAESAPKPGLVFLPGLLGAALGGALGYFAFVWLARQGFYALALPGALLGIGCALLSKHRSHVLAAVCGIGAIALGIFSEWRLSPFIKDDSFLYFLSHLHQLRPITLIMILVGGVLGFWFALRSKGR